MVLRGSKKIESRFTQYVEGLVGVIGHADRMGPLRDYCTGLIVSDARKSVEPMAAITAPERTAAQHSVPGRPSSSASGHFRTQRAHSIVCDGTQVR